MAPEAWPKHDLVGGSEALKKVIHFIGVFAPLKLNVLVEGESGTGKELFVRAIHLNSFRSMGPLIVVNCAAIPRDLIESELFGHEKGSFTGAWSQKKGKFELADGGTLFLDEIGDIPLDLQPKLLRAIEYGDIQRVGRQTDIHVDVRVVAATNKDLRAAVRSGAFRADLYFRLCTTPIQLPALRERKEDIPVLARHFISTLGGLDALGVPSKPIVTGISPEAVLILCNYHWPGNVRELRNVIARTIPFTQGDTIQAADLQMDSFDLEATAAPTVPSSEPLPEPETMNQAVLRTQRDFVLNAYQRVNGNLATLAKMIPVHRAGLSRFLDSLGLSYLIPPRGGYGTT